MTQSATHVPLLVSVPIPNVQGGVLPHQLGGNFYTLRNHFADYYGRLDEDDEGDEEGEVEMEMYPILMEDDDEFGL